MINKRSLWFLTLFSLILVLSVYYITMPSELLMESEEKMLDKITELKKILTNSKATTEEKNKAFEELQKLNKNKSLEEQIENKIEKELSYKSFVNIENSDVTVTVDSKKHDVDVANKIMRLVQSNFDYPMSISVKFKK